jgi:hypothetical protein
MEMAVGWAWEMKKGREMRMSDTPDSSHSLA